MIKVNMKLLSYINLILTLAPSLLYAQGIHLLGQIKYGTLEQELVKTNTFEKGSFYDLMPDDLEIDSENNIYLCDRFTKKILKFSRDMELIYTTEIDEGLLQVSHNSKDEYQKLNKSFYRVDLETDTTGNLYALVSLSELYSNLIKFDSHGELIPEFPLITQFPEQRLIDIFISSTGNIFINTFPHNLQDRRYIDDGLVFVYNLEGDFLGRADFFIEDSKGTTYRRNLLIKDYLQIDAYYPNTSGKVEKSSEEMLKTNMKVDYSNQKSWHFLGVDKFDNVYFIHGKQNVIVRKFNFSENTISDIKIEEKNLTDLKILFANNFNNICLTPDGDIIILGIQNTTGIKSLYDTYNVDEVSVVVIKLTQ